MLPVITEANIVNENNQLFTPYTKYNSQQCKWCVNNLPIT